jgi:hypothetical protein
MNKNLLLLLCLACALSAACHSSKVEPATKSASTAVPSTPTAHTPGPQPTEAELRDAIKRNYEDVVTIDSAQSTSFIIGDFNGDASEDIAVVVKPGKGKLAELNSEYVNWILEDPHQVQAREQKTSKAPVTITRNDPLLAVIHGVEGKGWRNALAKQTYLLKNAVGERFETESGRQLNNDSKALPLLRGDVIREKLDGIDGIIYWTGAKYAWHPVS